MHIGSADISTDLGLISGLPILDVLWTRMRLRTVFSRYDALCLISPLCLLFCLRSYHLLANVQKRSRVELYRCSVGNCFGSEVCKAVPSGKSSCAVLCSK
jgi:hypothetical protein